MLQGMRGLVVVGAVIGMPLASLFLVFRPFNHEITKRKADAEHTEQMLQKLREEIQRHADLEKAIGEIRESVKVAEERLPTDKEIDDVVRQVSDLALDAGLGAPGMKANKQLQAAQYMEQPLELEIKGSFTGFFMFMSNLEKLPRITRVTDLKITRNDKGSTDEEKLMEQVEFTLSIYFQRLGEIKTASMGSN